MERQASPAALWPLFAATAIGLLAANMYLPAVPALRLDLGGTAAQAQMTVAAFAVTFAIGLLVTGPLADRFGRLEILLGAAAVYVVASLLGSLADNMELLIAARALQGLGASAPATIIPAVITSSYAYRDAARMLGWLGAIEASIPALSPFVGIWIMSRWGWRACFLAFAVTGLLANLPLVTARGRFTWPGSGAIPMRSLLASYGRMARTRSFIVPVVTYAMAFGAMMTFVGTAPLILTNIYELPPQSFGWLQLSLVVAFSVGTLASPGMTSRFGLFRVLRIATILLVVTGAASLLLLGVDALVRRPVDYFALTLPAQFGLGLRFGISVNAALKVFPEAQATAASLAFFLIFCGAAIGNAAVAPFIGHGLAPVAIASASFALLAALILELGWRPAVRP